MNSVTDKRLRWPSALVGALAVHALLAVGEIGGASGGAIAERAEEPSLDSLEQETEIALVDETTPVPSRSELGGTSGTTEMLREGSSQRHRVREITAPLTGTLVEETASSTAEQGTAYGLDPAAPPPAARPVDVGIGAGSWARLGTFAAQAATSAHALPEAPAQGRAPTPASTTGGLQEALDSHDREIGLGAEGPALSAAREAALSEVAPRSGTAQFAISVYQSGEVEVALAAASSDAPSWTEVGSKIAASLRRKPPRIRSSRKGIRWIIELAAVERWPDGTAAKSEPSRPTATLPILRGAGEAKADLEKRNAAAAPPPGAPAEQRPMVAIADAPGVFVSGRGRAGPFAIGAGTHGEVGFGDSSNRVVTGVVLKGNADPTNLVGRPARAVSARVITETVL